LTAYPLSKCVGDKYCGVYSVVVYTRNVNFLYGVAIIIVAIIVSPFILVYAISMNVRHVRNVLGVNRILLVVLQVTLSRIIFIGGIIMVIMCYWLSDELPYFIIRYRGWIAVGFVVTAELVFGGMQIMFHKCRGMLGRGQFYVLLQAIGVILVLSSTQKWLPSLLILIAVIFDVQFRRMIWKLLFKKLSI